MSLLARVREKYGAPGDGTDRTDKTAPSAVHTGRAALEGTDSVSSVSPVPGRFHGKVADVVDLAEYRDALRLGRLRLCVQCRHYSGRPGAMPDGWCAADDVETWGRVPFPSRLCATFNAMEKR